MKRGTYYVYWHIILRDVGLGFSKKTLCCMYARPFCYCQSSKSNNNVMFIQMFADSNSAFGQHTTRRQHPPCVRAIALLWGRAYAWLGTTPQNNKHPNLKPKPN